jgi:AcrR family transcriptional regulator
VVSDKTRQDLLRAAYSEIHLQGYQSASLNAILNQTGVTKGALYHYFNNKQALGYAVLDEVIRPYLELTWIEPLRDKTLPPLARLIGTIQQAGERLDEREIQLGCPLNNLAQEMSPIDEGFRQRTDRLYRAWFNSIAATLEEGQRDGSIRADLEPASTAIFIVAALEGCMGIAKNAQSRQALIECARGVFDYLDSLSTDTP